MLLRIAALLSSLMLIACAQQLTHEDLNSIKKVAVVSTIKDELYFYNRGLTVFENKANSADISPWKLSSYLSNNIIKAAKEKNPTMDFKIVQIENPLNKKYAFELLPEILPKLKLDGFDSVLFITNGGIYTPAGGGSYIVDPQFGGFLFYTQSFLGKDLKNHICSQYNLGLYRLLDKKLLANRNKSEICAQSTTTLVAKPFDEFTSTEKEMTINELKADIDLTANTQSNNLFTPKSK